MSERELQAKLDIACVLLAQAIQRGCAPTSVQIANKWRAMALKSSRR